MRIIAAAIIAYAGSVPAHADAVKTDLIKSCIVSAIIREQLGFPNQAGIDYARYCDVTIQRWTSACPGLYSFNLSVLKVANADEAESDVAILASALPGCR